MLHRNFILLYSLASVLIVRCGFSAAPEEQDPAPARVTFTVIDADTKEPLPVRVYLADIHGAPLVLHSTDSDTNAVVRYAKRNRINREAKEFHRTVSAAPFYADLPPGQYQITVKRGKEYTPQLILPYPGGRHPRIGFLDGAIDPQRDSKFSVFLPWTPEDYVVVDLPEAIWSNLGLTYLAHDHIPTIWAAKGISLPRIEWQRREDGALTSHRELPNGISFGAEVRPSTDHLEMELWLRNGTNERLTDLRVQNCVMLKGAEGFHDQSNWNKLLAAPFAAARSNDGRHWIITAWTSCDRVWANPPVPCIHSDPRFPDLAPGKTGRVKGWLWFYSGRDIETQLNKLRAEFITR